MDVGALKNAPGNVVEYARFVEVQQRRARIVAELKRPPTTPSPPTRLKAVERAIDIDDSATAVDRSTTRGTD